MINFSSKLMMMLLLLVLRSKRVFFLCHSTTATAAPNSMVSFLFNFFNQIETFELQSEICRPGTIDYSACKSPTDPSTYFLASVCLKLKTACKTCKLAHHQYLTKPFHPAVHANYFPLAIVFSVQVLLFPRLLATRHDGLRTVVVLWPGLSVSWLMNVDVSL